jgi:hypothetical protein
MVISLIVTGVAFSIYRLNASYYLREDAYLQQYQNLRVALYTISRDVRMAGNGFYVIGPDFKLMQAFTTSREEARAGLHPPSEMVAVSTWFRHADTSTPGVRAIFGVDGGDTDPDTVTIFRAEVETGSPLAQVTGLSGNRLSLNNGISESALKSGDIIAVGSGTSALIFESDSISFSGGEADEIPVKPGGRFTASSSVFPAGFDPVGLNVYNFRDVGIITYWLDTARNALMASYHDSAKTDYNDLAGTSSIVASNIEDLQVYYFMDNHDVDFSRASNDPDISSTALDTHRVKAVALGITARSPYGDGPPIHRRPALFNRAEGTAPDNRLRNVLIETVFLRNFHT